MLSALSIGVFLGMIGMIQQSDVTNPLPPCPGTPNCERVSVTISASAKNVRSTALSVLEKMRVHSVEQEIESKINAVFRIPIFGWKDDFTILIEPINDQETTVHIRSASRTGRSDYGVNNRRIKRFIRWLEQDL